MVCDWLKHGRWNVCWKSMQQKIAHMFISTGHDLQSVPTYWNGEESRTIWPSDFLMSQIRQDITQPSTIPSLTRTNTVDEGWKRVKYLVPSTIHSLTRIWIVLMRLEEIVQFLVPCFVTYVISAFSYIWQGILGTANNGHWLETLVAFCKGSFNLNYYSTILSVLFKN